MALRGVKLLINRVLPRSLLGRSLMIIVTPLILLQVVLTWVVPFACVSYYPGLLLLGREEAQPWMAVVAPLAAAAMVVVASIVWRRGLARYQGTGH